MPQRHRGWYLPALTVVTLLGVSQLRAADLDQVGSLKWIPADAAFYSTSLRNKEMLEIVRQSKAWAKFKAMPAVKQLWQMVEAQLKEPSYPMLAEILKVYQTPENQQLLEFLGDMVSHEIFIYGSSQWTDFTDLLVTSIGATRYAPLAVIAEGNPEAANQAQLRAFLTTLDKNRDKLRTPDLVIGFKLTKKDVALAQLKRLDDLIDKAAAEAPPIKERVKRTRVAGSDFVVANLDGSLIPWHEVSLEQAEAKEGEFNDLVNALKKLKVTVALGIREDYLLLVFGETTDTIVRLGQGANLRTRPEFKPLLRHADRRLTNISYTSQAVRSKAATSVGDIEALLTVGRQALEQSPLTEEQKARLKKDIDVLAQDFKGFVRPVGAALSYAFLSERGQEGYSYDWTEMPGLDSSKPLTLLHHVGGSPILAAVTRSRFSPDDFKKLVGWIQKIHAYFEELALPHLPAEAKAQYEQVAKPFLPLARRLANVTGDLFLPGFADGQSAFVLDGKLRSQRLHMNLPGLPKPMPIPEPAIVMGVSDAAKVRTAFSEYRKIINEALTKIRELAPDFPEFQIPEAQALELKEGMLYTYPVFAQLGVDPQIMPTAGLSARVGVLALSQQHAQRILTRMPLKVEGGPLADLNKPRAGAVYFNWVGVVDMLSQWADVGGQLMAQQAPEGGANPKEILEQIRTGLELLKVFRGYTSSTYLEDGALVTHSETLIRDL